MHRADECVQDLLKCILDMRANLLFAVGAVATPFAGAETGGNIGPVRQRRMLSQRKGQQLSNGHFHLWRRTRIAARNKIHNLRDVLALKGKTRMVLHSQRGR